MPELNKLKTQRTQLNESDLFKSDLKDAICILTYIKPKFKIWGLNHSLGWIV